MKTFQLLTSGLLAAMLLTGCGGGGGGDAPAGSATLTGTFVDATVQGLSYQTATQSGTTGASGEFLYLAGETVEFKAGALSLGQSAAGAVVTPVDLVPGATAADSTTTANTKVQNIVRFLLASHTGGASAVTSSIVLNDTAKKAAAGSIDFAASDTSFVASVKTATGTSVVPTASEAQTHMGNSLGLLQAAGTYSGTYSGSSSGTWQMTVDKLGDIKGTATDKTSGEILTVTGTVAANGSFSFSSSGSASNGATFNGNVTAGVMSGTWNRKSTYESGAFNGTSTARRKFIG